MHSKILIVTGLTVFAANLAAEDWSMQVGGAARTLTVTAPAGTAKPPLVFALHGMGGNGKQHQSMSRFDAIANREKFVVAYPDGIDKRWDIGGAADVEFVLAILDSAAKRYDIDRNRVYATGFSMGGMMSYHLANRAADRIAAIGPVAGFLLGNDPHNSSRPMPIFHIHGDKDSVVAFSRLANVLKGWATRNECPQTPQVIAPYPATRADSKVSKQHWTPCSDSEIIALTIAGQGHGYSTGPDINSSEEIWTFFKRYTLAGASAIRPIAAGKPARQVFGVRRERDLLHVRGLRRTARPSILDLRGRRVASGGFDATSSKSIVTDMFE